MEVIRAIWVSLFKNEDCSWDCYHFSFLLTGKFEGWSNNVKKHLLRMAKLPCWSGLLESVCEAESIYLPRIFFMGKIYVRKKFLSYISHCIFGSLCYSSLAFILYLPFLCPRLLAVTPPPTKSPLFPLISLQWLFKLDYFGLSLANGEANTWNQVLWLHYDIK